jgi:hypothetical protein
MEIAVIRFSILTKNGEDHNTSAKGKEALIGLLDGGDFFGESCRATKYKELESD